jgi:hypothetical protein
MEVLKEKQRKLRFSRKEVLYFLKESLHTGRGKMQKIKPEKRQK